MGHVRHDLVLQFYEMDNDLAIQRKNQTMVDMRDVLFLDHESRLDRIS